MCYAVLLRLRPSKASRRKFFVAENSEVVASSAERVHDLPDEPAHRRDLVLVVRPLDERDRARGARVGGRLGGDSRLEGLNEFVVVRLQ
jgi:hypothetical protein